MKFPVLSIILLGFIRSQILFPLSQKLPIQWVYEGLYQRCDDNSTILAKNCNNNQDKFIECYQIPSGGLCTNFITSQSDVIYALLDFKFKNQSSFILKINGKQNNYTQILKSRDVVTFKNPQVPFQLSISHDTGDELYLIQAKIQESILSDNCIKQDQNYQCLLCADTYYLYQWQCVPTKCVAELSNLVINGISQRTNYSNGTVTQDFIINNLKTLGDCIVPKLYLINSFDNTSMIYIFPTKYLSRPDQKSVRLSIPLTDFIKLPCNALETSTDNVTQCYVSFTATIQGVNQFQYVSIIRLSINKNTSTQVTYNNQGFMIPDICCQSLQVNVLNEAKIQNVVTNGSYKYIIAQQILRDPHYKNQKIKFIRAYLIGNNTYDLNLVNSTINSDTMTVTFYLLVDPKVDLSEPQLKVRLQSSLSVNGRILESRTDNVRPTYMMSTIIELDNQQILAIQNQTFDQSQSLRRQDNSKNYDYLYYLLIVVIFLLTLAVAFFRHRQKNNKVHTKNDEEIVVTRNELG